jgi:glycosyltransferase involved in cell wall biosynthesis
MRSFLIKIGKAWSVLGRDGLVRGGVRIVSSGLALFRRVRPGDILFVTGGVGDSARYRCDHVAEELRLHGFRVSVTVQDNLFLASYVGQFSVFIFHRTMLTPSVARLIARIKEQKKEIIFETDDLTFDADLFKTTDAYAQMNALERKLYEHGLGGEILADPYVTVATTTTAFLADRLREKGKQVFIVPNKLSEEDIETVDHIRKSKIPARPAGGENRKSCTLAYFSGSASHDRDFATVTGPLLAIMEKYQDVMLAIYGPLVLDMRFEPFHDRIVREPYASRKHHFANIAQADINLAPLVMGDPFCESKSELKFFEAGICGVPTVASATRTFREAITDGVDGFACASSEEWMVKLDKLITDPEFRKSMGEKARETALAKYVTTGAGNEEYHEFLRKKLKN